MKTLEKQKTLWVYMTPLFIGKKCCTNLENDNLILRFCKEHKPNDRNEEFVGKVKSHKNCCVKGCKRNNA